MKYKVVLFNRQLTSVCQPQIVQGSNGERIGISRFDPTRAHHILELSLEDYERAARAISDTAHLAMRKWEPHFVAEDEVKVEMPVVAPEPQPVPGLRHPPVPMDQRQAVQREIPAQVRHPDTYSPPPPQENKAEHADLVGAKFFSLQKIARQEKVDISECEGVEHVKAAIIRARESKLQPA